MLYLYQKSHLANQTPLAEIIFPQNSEKDRALFIDAMTVLSNVIKSTGELSLVTDGERRYSKYLFQICYDFIKDSKPGRPKKALPENLRVRLKNKGSQAHKRGPKKQKLKKGYSGR